MNNFKYIVGLVFLIIITNIQITKAQDSLYTEETSPNLYHFNIDSITYVFVNMANIREQANPNSALIDSISLGTPVKIIQENSQTFTEIKGMKLPWIKIEYQVNNQKKKGYIWAGLLSLDTKIDQKTGNKFIFGIAWKSNEIVKPYYWVEAKVLSKENNLLASNSFPYYPFYQGYAYANLENTNSILNSENIYSITFTGEACGIPTNTFQLAWNNNKLIPLPSLTSVSDAGIYYHEEELIFPQDHKKGKDLLYKRIEEGESEEDINDDSASEIKYKIKKSEEIYQWNGDKWVLLSK